jgi:hypothetical protein
LAAPVKGSALTHRFAQSFDEKNMMDGCQMQAYRFAAKERAA